MVKLNETCYNHVIKGQHKVLFTFEEKYQV
jgi:hypothetical protein